jgi:hypothetical protein
MRMASSRNLSRLAAKKRPNDRPFLSFSIRSCHSSALLPIRSRMPANFAEILALPSRKSRTVWSTRRIRSSTHCLRSSNPSPSKNARRTQREMQWYQRVTDTSTNSLRAIVLGGSPWKIRMVYANAVWASRSYRGDFLRISFSDRRLASMGARAPHSAQYLRGIVRGAFSVDRRCNACPITSYYVHGTVPALLRLSASQVLVEEPDDELHQIALRGLQVEAVGQNWEGDPPGDVPPCGN